MLISGALRNGAYFPVKAHLVCANYGTYTAMMTDSETARRVTVTREKFGRPTTSMTTKDGRT